VDISLWYWRSTPVYTAEHMQNGFGHIWRDLCWCIRAWTRRQTGWITTTMLTFGMGAPAGPVRARGRRHLHQGGGVGADLVGKVESGIRRTTAQSRDHRGQRGRHVGDVAGMGADLYESYCGAILSTAALGACLPATSALTGVDAVIAR
jgi:K(+)-stimulated pyrophosphate-energized sodium pump